MVYIMKRGTLQWYQVFENRHRIPGKSERDIRKTCFILLFVERRDPS